MAGAGDTVRERGWRDAAAGGDAAAWCELFESAWERVEAYARWRVGGRDDLADEVVQETWLVAARRIASFEPANGSFAGWVRGIAANVVRNLVRNRRRAAARVRPLADDDGATVVTDDDTAERVTVALAELPEHYEGVLRMKYVDQLSVNEIAALTNETAKSVESLLSRARAAFRELYLREPS